MTLLPPGHFDPLAGRFTPEDDLDKRTREKLNKAIPNINAMKATVASRPQQGMGRHQWAKPKEEEVKLDVEPETEE